MQNILCADSFSPQLCNVDDVDVYFIYNLYVRDKKYVLILFSHSLFNIKIVIIVNQSVQA